MSQVVTYKGNTDGTDSGALDVNGTVLALDEPTEVSADVVKALKAKPNSEAYKIDFNAKEGD